LSHPVNESDTMRSLEEALALVRGRIATACARAGRRPEEVTLVGVTKGVDPRLVRIAARAGLADLGENYVQELEAKRPFAPEATWHFIGRLQRNKVPRIVAASDLIQTLEPGSATERLVDMARQWGSELPCLVEVDSARGRVGVPPDQAPAFIERMASVPGLRVTGLMTVAPLVQDPRPAFSALRELRDRMQGRVEGVIDLSMGMSADLEAAVEEGATMVRVGTAIFGPRPERKDN
jgi:PLP dependent protein